MKICLLILKIILSPLENALETIKEKNKDILIKANSSLEYEKKLEALSPLNKYRETMSRTAKDHISQLGMVLNGNLK